MAHSNEQTYSVAPAPPAIRRRRQAAVILGTVAFAILVVTYLAFQNLRPVGEFVTVTKEALPFAESKALGSADALVTILEFSDFQ